MNYRRRLGRVLGTAAMASAVVGGAMSAPATSAREASAPPSACAGYDGVPEVGRFAREVADHLYELCDPVTGVRSRVHSHAAESGGLSAGDTGPLPPQTSQVNCPVHNYGPQVVFLYGNVEGQPWRYLDVRPQLQSIIGRMNYKIQNAARASGGTTAALETPCMLQNGAWVPWVGGLINRSGSPGGHAPHSFQDIEEAVYGEYPRYGHDGKPIKYVVFYDSNATPYGGQGSWIVDDRRWNNYNATSPGVAYVRLNLWETNVTLHEMFHTFGAVQVSAPHSNWIGHCNDGADVMCYGQQGQPGAYPGPYDDYRCSYTEEAGYVPLDCKYDTYFDAYTAPGSYLGNYWNTGAATNPFIWFPTTMDFSLSANPSSLNVTAGQSASTTITLTSANNFSGTVNLSVTGVPSGSSATFSSSSVALSSNGTASRTLTVTPAATRQAPFTLTVTGCGPIGCRSTSVTVTPRYFTISVDPSTLPTLPGQTKSATVTLTSRNGFSGTVNLTASEVPTGNVVAFVPTAVSVPAFGSRTARIDVTTGQIDDYSFVVNACQTPCASARVYVDVQLL